MDVPHVAFSAGIIIYHSRKRSNYLSTFVGFNDKSALYNLQNFNTFWKTKAGGLLNKFSSKVRSNQINLRYVDLKENNFHKNSNQSLYVINSLKIIPWLILSPLFSFNYALPPNFVRACTLCVNLI